MIAFITKFKTYIIYGLLSLFSFPLMFGGFSHAEDLLSQITKPAEDASGVIKAESVDIVGGKTLKNKNSIIIRVTKLLLILTIVLSITMILYNGMIYIIETGQGKEGKSLAKNVAYIVIGIIIALVSSVIIALIQSIPQTLDKELTGSPQDDESILNK